MVCVKRKGHPTRNTFTFTATELLKTKTHTKNDNGNESQGSDGKEKNECVMRKHKRIKKKTNRKEGKEPSGGKTKKTNIEKTKKKNAHETRVEKHKTFCCFHEQTRVGKKGKAKNSSQKQRKN